MVEFQGHVASEGRRHTPFDAFKLLSQRTAGRKLVNKVVYRVNVHVMRVQQERVACAELLNWVSMVEIPLEARSSESALVKFGLMIVQCFSTTITCCTSNGLIQMPESVLLDEHKDLTAGPVLPATLLALELASLHYFSQWLDTLGPAHLREFGASTDGIPS